jgi:hypothetical protein
VTERPRKPARPQRRRSSVLVGVALTLALAIAACSGSPGSSLAPSGSPPIGSPASTPLATSPSPRGSSASATPSATATAGPTANPSARYPWLPPIDTTVAPTFEVDAFVTARAAVAPVSEVPGGPPLRFDTGDPDPSTHPVIGFARGGLLVVLHGPVVVDGVEWYLLTPAQLAIDVPTGWSPLIAPDGEVLLEDRPFACPASPLRAEDLSGLMLTDGLPACYGSAEITIVGDLTCAAGPDQWASGASWLAGGICSFDPPPTVYGLAADLPTGRYAVTGHFDDPEAWACLSTDGDTPSDRLVAVLHCRRGFVATSIEAAG